MSRRKLKHFDEMKQMAHVFEPTLAWQRGENLQLKGTWGTDRKTGTLPGTGLRPGVILELACGGGDYTVALAQRFPDSTIVGVDIKGSRMWWGAKKAADLKLSNAKFLRTQIENLADFFEEGEIDEIWITFPNPHPTKGNAKRRLTSRRFLEIYKRLLKPGGLVHLKTDDKALYEFSLETLPLERFKVEVALEDVYGAEQGQTDTLWGIYELRPGEAVDTILTEVQTQYERRYLREGRKIKYVRGRG